MVDTFAKGKTYYLFHLSYVIVKHYYHEVAGEDVDPFSGNSKPTTADR